MPRKPKGAPVGDSSLEQIPGNDQGETSENTWDEDLEPPEPEPPGPPSNQLDPQPDRIAREDDMSSKGEVPWYKIHCKRITPDKIKHPQTGMFVPCDGQVKKFEGQFTSEQIETKLHDYFGGGDISVIAYDPGDRMKIAWRKNFKFAGEPNISNILGDCMTQQLAESMGIAWGASGQGGTQSPLYPGPIIQSDPLKAADLEVRTMEAEARKEEAKVEVEERKLAAKRRRERMIREAEAEERREREEREAREADERLAREEGFVFEGQGAPLARPGAARFARRGFVPQPLDEMDRPITMRDSLIQDQIRRLEAQNEKLMERLERANESPRGGSGTKELILGLGTVLAPILGKIIEVQAESSAATRESNSQLIRTVLESGNRSEKTMELLMQAVAIKDNREAHSIENFTKLIEIGANMADGRGGGEDSTIEKVGRAAGDVLNGVISAFRGGGGGAPAGVPMMIPQQPQRPPQALLPAPVRPNVPMPGQSSAAPRPSSPPPPAHQAPPPQQAAPAAPVAPAGPAHSEVPTVPIEALPAGLAERLIREIVEQSEAKPEDPKWVETAFEKLPNTWILLVAQAGSFADLAEVLKPHIPMSALLQYGPKLQEPGMAEWIQAGFAWLQEQCRDHIKGDGDGEASAGEAQGAPVPEESFGEDKPNAN